MDDNTKKLQSLFKAYLDNSLSKEQYEEFWQLLDSRTADSDLDPELKELWQNVMTEQVSLPDDEWNSKMQMLKSIVDEKEKANLSITRPVSYRTWFKWAAAAVLLITLSLSAYLLTISRQDKKITSHDGASNDIPGSADVGPGRDKATLTLGDGSTIILDSNGNGLLAKQGNTDIIKQQDGQLVYNAGQSGNIPATFNTLTTPKGGQYKLILPDGTKIWLNAASSLKFPTAFTGKERRIAITGEAYFEVAKDAAKPFVVELNQMEVQVLGTKFNINGYDDEDVIRTTLLEGSLKVKSDNDASLLTPGQQAQLKSFGKIKVVKDADIEETIAWKEGNFQFENADINIVMRQLARWYNVKVEYEGNVKKHFGGTIPRTVNLSKVLDMLQQTGEIHFIIKGETVIVKP